jgi:hypothetical protein
VVPTAEKLRIDDGGIVAPSFAAANSPSESLHDGGLERVLFA